MRYLKDEMYSTNIDIIIEYDCETKLKTRLMELRYLFLKILDIYYITSELQIVLLFGRKDFKS